MTIPYTTGTFDLCDWNGRAGSTAAATDETLSGGSNPFTAYAATTSLAPVADSATGGLAFIVDGERVSGAGTIACTARLDEFVAPLGSTFTFEFDVELVDLPMTFSSAQTRAMIGLGSQASYSVGLAFSYQGIALVDGLHDTNPSVLGGSRELILDDNGSPKTVTIRAIVDAEDDTIKLYIADTAVAYAAAYGGDDWADVPNLGVSYTLSGAASGWTYGAALYVGVSANNEQVLNTGFGSTRAEAVTFVVRSLRVASTKLVPEAKPTAEITASFYRVAGEAITCSGAGSADAHSRPLSYIWDVDQKPLGSHARLSSPAYAEVTLGTAADDNEVLVAFQTATSIGDDWSLQLSALGANQVFTTNMDFDNQVVRMSLGTDGAGAVTTTAAEFIEAFARATAGGYDADLAGMFDADLVDATATNIGAMPTGTYPLSGGAGSTAANPVLLTDEYGKYVVSLRVNNGLLTSNKVTHTVQCTASNQLFAHVPDMDFVFKYIGDFWDLLSDKKSLSTVWSAMTQVVSDELLRTWQHDLAKTISGISRRYQRRWLDYSFYQDVGDGTYSVVEAPSVKHDVTPVNIDGSPLSTSFTVAYASRTAPLPTGYKGLFRGQYSTLQVGQLQYIKANTASTVWFGTTSPAAVPYAKSLLSGSVGKAVEDPTAPGATSDLWSDASVVFAPAAQAGDLLQVRDMNGVVTHTYTVLSVSRDVPDALKLNTAMDVTGMKYAWTLVRPCAHQYVEVTPYFEFDTTVTVSAFGLGDYVEVAFTATTGEESTVRLPILAVDDQSVFVSWRPLLEWIGGIQGQSLDTAHTASILAAVTWKVSRLCRAKRSAKKTDLVGVPYMGTTPKGREFTEKLDHSVSDNRVVFTDVLSGTAAAQGDQITFSSQPDYGPLYSTGFGADELEALGSYTLVVSEGDVGVYTVRSAVGRTWRLEENLTISGSSEAYVPRYGAANPHNGTMWAELSLFDNWEMIQNNFGLLVGLPKELLTGNIDYLSAVRGLWFAFVHGPSFKNTQLATQALFGLPAVEKEGAIIRIEAPTDSDDLGAIILQHSDGTTTTHGYPYGASLGLDPATGEELKVDAARTLPGGTALVNVIKVDDYITDPDLMENLLPGQEIIKKYHTFSVRVPLDVVGQTAPFSVLSDMIGELKPARTNFILYGMLPFQDTVDISDTLGVAVTYHPLDTLHTAPFCGDPAVFDGDGDTPCVWPREETIDVRGWSYTDVFEKYESGYATGLLNDRSGDGSWNAARGMVHPVNQLNPDINVHRSYLWVPVLKDFLPISTNVEAEFQVGEELQLIETATGNEPAAAWYDAWRYSNPVMEHIGAGYHPQLPFEIESPQYKHPYTYLLLGFDGGRHNSGVITSLGDERRLDVLSSIPGLPFSLANYKIIGVTSGAEAIPTVAPDRTNAAHDAYFILDEIFRLNLLEETNPEITTTMVVSQYIPMGGTAPAAFRSGALDDTTYPNTGRQVQMHPYDTAVADTMQMVPSFGPGMYTQWNVAPASVEWDYVDKGNVAVTGPHALNSFVKVPTVTSRVLENVHIALRTWTLPKEHYTHGFTRFELLPPAIRRVSWSSAALQYRVEGYYFVEPLDVSDGLTPAHIAALDDTAAPYLSALTALGTPAVGGCWAFVRLHGTATEWPFQTLSFESGQAVGTGLRWVLGKDGFYQTSSGHVLEGTIPAGLPIGTYDLVVRNYHAWAMYTGGTQHGGVKEDAHENAIVVSSTGMGTTPYGFSFFGSPD